MITTEELRQHIRAAADDLGLPLTIKQADLLTEYVADQAGLIPAPRGGLSRQRFAVLLGIASGEDTGDTARRLCLSYHTVKTHKRHLYKALGAVNGAQAVAIASRRGLLPPTGGDR